MRICYLHNGPRRQCSDCGGCECVHDWDDYVPPKTVLVGRIPGGSKDTGAYKAHMDFDKDMNSYKAATEEGLEPATISQKGVAEARAEVQSHKRALKKLGVSADDAKKSGVLVAPGVE